MNCQQGEGTVQALDHVGECGRQVTGFLKLGGDQVGGNLGIGLRGKFCACGHQLSLELIEVFDDSVVNQRQLGGRATDVRVSISICRRPVGCPAGVTNANVGIWQRVVGDLVDEVVELAGFFAGFQTGARNN